MIQIPLTPFADFVPTPNTPPSEDVLGGVSKHCYQSADDGRSNSDEGSAVGAGCDSGGVSCSGGDRDDGERSATRARKDLNENPDCLRHCHHVTSGWATNSDDVW